VVEHTKKRMRCSRSVVVLEPACLHMCLLVYHPWRVTCHGAFDDHSSFYLLVLPFRIVRASTITLSSQHIAPSRLCFLPLQGWYAQYIPKLSPRHALLLLPLEIPGSLLAVGKPPIPPIHGSEGLDTEYD
jgi:hypothetical protein